MSWFASHPLHKYITVVAFKLYRQRPRKIRLILEVIISNTQVFKKKKKVYLSASDPILFLR